jgi:hypothetical protein
VIWARTVFDTDLIPSGKAGGRGAQYLRVLFVGVEGSTLVEFVVTEPSSAAHLCQRESPAAGKATHRPVVKTLLSE